MKSAKRGYFRHNFFLLLLLVGSSFLMNCSGGGGGGGSNSKSSPPPGNSPPPVVSITVTSSTSFVPPGKTETFSAAVSGSSNTSVTWSVEEPGGGSITDAGIYTAPTIPSIYHVIATSGADPSKTATITITVPQYPRYAYVASPYDRTVSIFTVDSVSGLLKSNGHYYLGSVQPPGQYAVAIDPTGSYLYEADMGNSDIWAYSINPSSNFNTAGKLTPIGSIAASGAPTSLIADPLGQYVFVANSNGENSNGTVSVYTIGEAGGLSEIQGSPYVAGTDPNGIAIDPSGSFLFVSNFGGGVSAYSIAGTGALNSVSGSPFPTGTNPEAIAIDPTGEFLFVANNDGSLNSYSISETGSLNSIGSISVSSSLNAMTIDPSGEYLYLTNSASDQIYAYSINPTSGALVAVTGSPYTTGPIPQSISVDSSGQFLYVANLGSEDLWEFSISRNTGVLTQNGTVRSRSGSYAMAFSGGNLPVSYTPRFAYAPDFITDTVYTFSINSSSGALTNVDSNPTGTDPVAIASDPSGQHVFVANSGTNNISAYTADPVTGSLSESPYSPFSTNLSPQALVVDQSGSFLYVANQSSNSVTIFPIDQIFGGILPETPVAQTVGPAPQTLTIDPTGQFLFVGFLGSGSDVSVYQIDPNLGGLTLVSGSPFGAGSNPYSIAVNPTGTFAYATDDVLMSNNVAGFSITANNSLTTGQQGSLNLISTVSAGSMATGITTDRTGKFLFVANSGSASVTTFTIDSNTGNLSKMGDTNPWFSIANPYAIQVDLTGQFAYVADETSGFISVFNIDPNNGLASLAPISTLAYGESCSTYLTNNPQGTCPGGGAIATTGLVQ